MMTVYFAASFPATSRQVMWLRRAVEQHRWTLSADDAVDDRAGGWHLERLNVWEETRRVVSYLSVCSLRPGGTVQPADVLVDTTRSEESTPGAESGGCPMGSKPSAIFSIAVRAVSSFARI